MSQSDNAETPVRNDELAQSIEFNYANVTNITTTKWDVQLAFGHRVERDNSFPVSGIVMSHLHAKELARLLTSAVEQLEEVAGEIKDPSLKIAEHNRKVEQKAPSAHT